MSGEDSDGIGYLSPKDMQGWMRQEIKDATKALELRIREATDFVSEYALGNLTPQEADERWSRYQHRWGEALPGATASEGLTDDEITRKIDQTRGDYTSPADSDTRYSRMFRKQRGSSGRMP
jgi:hypothetical protein